MLQEIERLKVCVNQASEENVKMQDELQVTKKDHNDLIAKVKSLEEENDRTENRLKAQGQMIVSLRAQVSATPKRANDALTTENKMLVSKIADMKEEIAAYSQSFRDFEANEAVL